jgi:uncharacterized MnhB-related membrane protein
MTPVQDAALILVAVVGTLVVLCRRPERQALMLAVYGLVLSVLFFAVSAPDVALSSLVVGAVVLPLIILLTLAKVRRSQE